MSASKTSQTECHLFFSDELQRIKSHIDTKFAGLQTRFIVCGSDSLIEISSDIPAEKGGPMTVCKVIINNSGVLDF